MIHGFDTHFHDLMEHPACAQTDCSSLRIGLLAAGLASTEPVARRAQRVLCHTVSGWGMTEVGVGAALGFPTDTEDDRCLASGAPLPGYEFKVIDPETGHTAVRWPALRPCALPESAQPSARPSRRRGPWQALWSCPGAGPESRRAGAASG